MKNKKIKQNKYLQIIQAELDLHGFTREEAREEIFNFLKEAEDKKYCKIRIITGKGIHSKNNQGILSDFVKDILAKEGLEYCDSKINEGGKGSLDVKL